jgi:putative Mn2+ efflux pump MntP
LWHTGTVKRVDFGSVLLMTIGLSADCFAAAPGASTSAKGISRLQILRVSLAFGAARAIMRVLGWLGRRTFVKPISDCDHWVAFGLPLVIGGRMIWESFRSKEDEVNKRDICEGRPAHALDGLM